MQFGRQGSTLGKTQVVVLTSDAAFAEQARATFGASPQIELSLVSGSLGTIADGLALDHATVAVVDLDPSAPNEMPALERLMGRGGTQPPVVVVTQSFDAALARVLLQMRVADFMVKPVSPVDLVRTGARVAKSA
ncbi:MAG: response regulator transcription factor, partial [Hyphomicrobiales bacterium]|nr:response regulator transcription factor [Hyphomicrobiales bacterium]